MKVGDILTVDVPDTRRWVRLFCWLTRRPLPTRRQAFKITRSILVP